MSDDQVGDESPIEDPEGLDLLIAHLAQVRGFDFSGYKRRSLARRVHRRMSALGVMSFAEYVDHLQVHPDEFQLLFDMLLIHVTSFFRDPAAWDALRERLVRLIDSKPAGSPVRVWSACCATGEEPYTIAMILAEHLGRKDFAERVKIYATDIDEAALREARQATYSGRVLENVPRPFLDKYFSEHGDGLVFDKELRRAVIFGGHDLVRDAPISRVDLLICRNALMYFNAETQAQILSRLHFALSSDGLLFLGKAEMLVGQGHLFTSLDLPFRVFQRASRSYKTLERTPSEEPTVSLTPQLDDPRRSLAHLAFESGAVAQVVVDASGKLEGHDTLHGVLLAFFDVTAPHQLDQELHRMSFQLEAAQLEVQSVGEELQTTNEELQSTIEELETTNEELQSANEELEATNEELQSTNQELHTINQELRERSQELTRANIFQAAILSSIRSAVAVLDDDLLVRAWSPAMSELWSLRADEVEGTSFLDLDTGLPLDELRGAVRACHSSAQASHVVVDGVNRRGRVIRGRVSVSPLPVAGRLGVILSVDEIASS